MHWCAREMVDCLHWRGGGTLETRVKEHRDASQKGALEKSALAEHAWMNQEVSVNEQARTAKKY